MPNAIPEGFHTITPHLTMADAAAAIDFYRRAFGAEELYRLAADDGRILHATLRIGDSRFMLNDPYPGQPLPVAGACAVILQLHVPDADATFTSATAAGAQIVVALDDMPWGDRYGVVADPFGVTWSIATRTADVTDDEVKAKLS